MSKVNVTFNIDEQVVVKVVESVTKIISDFHKEQDRLFAENYLKSEFKFTDELIKSAVGQQAVNVMLMAVNKTKPKG